MPSSHAAVDLALGHESTLVSSNSEENLLNLEAGENQDQEDSEDEDSGLSDYETESDDNKEVVSKETLVPEKAPPTGKSTGISGAPADSDDTFRARFDLEMKHYKKAKMRFLLSLVHDNKSTKGVDDENTLEKVCTLFGDEIIILRNLNDNVDNKIRSGITKEKKTKRDRNLRVKSRSRTSSRESTLDTPLENERRRTHSENYQNASTHERDLGLPTNTVVDGNAVQEETSVGKNDNDVTVERFQFEEHPSPEMDAERERKMKLRKMYRWERFQFGRFELDAKTINEDLTASTHDLDNKIEFRIPRKQFMTKKERREKIGDSLFKDEPRNNVCYIDSKYAGMEQPIMPIITSSNYQKVLIPEPPIVQTPSINQKTVFLSEKVESKTPNLGETPAGCGVIAEVGDEEVKQQKEPKKGKKDKKKKRKSSSSSDDLEELERKSEARLGKRK